MLQVPRLATVTKYALISRFLLFMIQVLFNLLIPDHEADVFNPPPNPNTESTELDVIVQFLIGGFRRWDAIYFLHVAEYGYTYENTIVFFPLFPMTTRILANTVFYPIQFFLSYSNTVLLWAFLLNNFLFVKCAQLLYKLGLSILNEENLAFKAAILFCFNPASVFMSAPYSETIYCFLLMSSMESVHRDSNVKAAILIGLCTLARSNGLIALGFVLYSILEDFMKTITGFAFVKTLLCGIAAAAPFLIYQYICYWNFCNSEVYELPEHIIQYGWKRNYHILGDDLSPWCHDIIPLSYGYVQKHHWEVGFMKYYEKQQIPNFLLATPIVILSLSCVWTYFKRNTWTCLTLGLGKKTSSRQKTEEIEVDLGFKNKKLLVHCGHLLFLVLFGLCFVHIQVLTRMLCSSCPVLFWYSAYLITDKLQPAETINRYDTFKALSEPKPRPNSESDIFHQFSHWSLQSLIFKSLLIYFLGYFVLGTIAFSNFLPFT
ncbi:hypothetical protein LOTGIDRAFT_237256 [Lottia gigantea]|uniref:GPI mannosyltransferase 2 n=1 Tax=Lottia gigantea TaxID=225164 RepID=V4BAY5_LOTGI|nr:hypothetical protein LOTGIDRAFT_237256 [Lottia gigantea]ESP04696.1 hypothetical protein LOTGIDRAFT_237256 [Lottia gigantea]